jgi:hypothetical protein
MAIAIPSPSNGDILEKEAGRELAAFLRAVEETQGVESVEKAGTIWIDILSNRPQLDFCSQASFRSITLEAAGSLVSLLGQASTRVEPEYETARIDQAVSRRIHLVARLAARETSAQPARSRVLFPPRTGAGGLGLVS